MIRTIRFCAVALALASAGCQSASVPMAPPGMDNAGRQFAPPPAGLAAVYFFNPSSASPVLNVRADGREIGQLGTQTWMRAEFAPGNHTFHCWGGSSTNQTTIRVAPGDMRFINVQMLPGQYVCSIGESDPDTGRAGVTNGSRAMQ
jgi:hypothetical protein